jgi:hypothetical protein
MFIFPELAKLSLNLTHLLTFSPTLFEKGPVSWTHAWEENSLDQDRVKNKLKCVCVSVCVTLLDCLFTIKLYGDRKPEMLAM